VSDFVGFLVEALVNWDEDGNTYEAGVIIQAVAEDGSALITQELDPDALRAMAFHFLVTADIAERQADVMTALARAGQTPDQIDDLMELLATEAEAANNNEEEQCPKDR
jgi:DNA-binding TFAR19-related protein (PDSD5 family)